MVARLMARKDINRAVIHAPNLIVTDHSGVPGDRGGRGYGQGAQQRCGALGSSNQGCCRFLVALRGSVKHIKSEGRMQCMDEA